MFSRYIHNTKDKIWIVKKCKSQLIFIKRGDVTNEAFNNDN